MKPSSVMLFLTRCLLLLMVTILSQLPKDMDAKINSDAFFGSFSYVDSDGRRRRVRPWISGPGWRSARSIANNTNDDEDELVDQADKIADMRAAWDKHQRLCGGHIPSAVCCVPKIPPLVGWSEGDPFEKIAPIPFGDGKRKKKTDTIQNSEQQPGVVDSSDGKLRQAVLHHVCDLVLNSVLFVCIEEPGVVTEQPRRSKRNMKNKRKAPAETTTSAPKDTAGLSKNVPNLPGALGQSTSSSKSRLPVASTSTAFVAPIIASPLDVLRLSKNTTLAGLGSTPAQGSTISAAVSLSDTSRSLKAPLGIAGSVLHALGLLDPLTGKSIKGTVATCSPMPRVPSGSSAQSESYDTAPEDVPRTIGEHQVAQGKVPQLGSNKTAPPSVSPSSSCANSLFGDCLDSPPDIPLNLPVDCSVPEVSTAMDQDSSSMDIIAVESGLRRVSGDSDLISPGHGIQSRKSIKQAANSSTKPSSTKAENSGVEAVSSVILPSTSSMASYAKTAITLPTENNTVILSSSNAPTHSPPNNVTTTSKKRRRSINDKQPHNTSTSANPESERNYKRRHTEIDNVVVSSASGTSFKSTISALDTPRPGGEQHQEQTVAISMAQ